MKRVLSFVLSICMMVAAVPTGTVFVAVARAAETVLTDGAEAYFLPIVIDEKKKSAMQGNETVDVIEKDGKYLIDADDVDGADTAQKGLVSAEAFAREAGAEIEDGGDVTVISKPFQTRCLIVEATGAPPRLSDASVIKYSDSAFVYEFETEEQTKAAYDTLQHSRRVQSVRGEQLFVPNALTENDFKDEGRLSWGSSYVGADYVKQCLEETPKEEKVTVAVIDSGIDTDHPFFEGRVSDKSVDKSASGSYEDEEGHGTHCCGIIAENTPSNVELMVIKAGNAVFRELFIISAINYAVDNGADIISMSFSTPNPSDLSIDAVKRAYDAGVIPVASAGNDAESADEVFPASSPYCITVAATDESGTPASFSNYGDGTVDIAAPGVIINSTVPGGGYALKSGTSMAAPLVAAFCADDILVNGAQTAASARAHVCNDPLPFKYDDYTGRYGAGIINFGQLIHGEVTAPVLFDKQSGVYVNECTVSLSCADSDAEIYYTLETPNEKGNPFPSRTNGVRYTEPLTLTAPTAVRAVAYSEGKLPSKVTQGTYRFNASADGFTVNEKGVVIKYTGTDAAVTVPDYVGETKVVGIAKSLFLNNTTITSVVLPDAVTTLGEKTFSGCKKLESVTAKGVTAIGSRCFYNDYSLKSVETGSLKTVGEYCFYNCSPLNENGIDISLLSSVPSYAFASCGFVNLALYDAEVVNGGAFYNNDSLETVSLPQATTVGGFPGCKKLTTVYAPRAVAVENGAFSGCEALTDIRVQNVKRIGDNAFSSCHTLTDIDVKQATAIGRSAFSGTKITTIDLPAVETIGDSCFDACADLETVNINNLRTVPANAFRYCSSLREIPRGCRQATTIGDAAFSGCTGIAEIDLPEVKEIGENAFSGCTSAATFNVPNVLRIGLQSLNIPGLTVLTLPKAEYVSGFSDNTFLEKAVLPRCFEMGTNAFSGCTNLKEVDAPILNTVGQSAFTGDAMLEHITLQNLENIGRYAFSGCSGLSSLYLPRCKNALNASNGMSGIKTLYAPHITTVKESVSYMSALENIVLAEATGFESRFATGVTLKDVSLPAATSISFQSGSATAQPAEMMLHAPSLKTFTMHYSYYCDAALPSTVQTVKATSRAIDGHLTFYTPNAQAVTVGTGIADYEFKPTVALKQDLPAAFAATDDDFCLYVTAYSTSPVYQWYFSADGEAFAPLQGNNRYALVPRECGYYYCTVSDADGGTPCTSSVCHVTTVPEMAGLTVAFESENACALCDGVMLPNLQEGETVYFPKGKEITLLLDGTVSALFAGDTRLTEGENGFTFTLDDAVSVRYTTPHIIKAENVTVTSTPVDPFHEETMPNCTVTAEGQTLVEGVDYTISCVNNRKSGSNAYCTVTGIGAWSGSVTKHYLITSLYLRDCTFGTVPDQKYTGAPLTPALQITYQGRDITPLLNITYAADNIYPCAECGIYVTPKDNDIFSADSKTVYFKIYADRQDVNISLEKTVYTFTGEAITPPITVSIGDKTLKEKTDYLVFYSQNKDPGNGLIKIVFLSDLYGTEEECRYFTIEDPNHLHEHVFTLAVTENSTCTEPGRRIYRCGCGEEMTEVVPPHHRNQYRVTTSDVNNPDTTVIITYCGACGAELKREKIFSLKAAKVTGISDCVYTGKGIKPTIRIKVGKATLTEGKDYQITYRNNTAVGTATVIITGKAHYQDVIKRTFRIVPKGTELSKLRAKKKSFVAVWKKQTKSTDGYQLQYSADKRFKKGCKTVTVKKNTTLKATAKKLKAKKTYYVRVRTYKKVNGKQYASAWSKVKTVKIK